MQDTFLIGLTGRAGCGKDTVAHYLNHSTYAFARPLKDALAAMGFPEPTRKLKEALIPGFKFSWRKAAQTLGTEWGRGLQSDLWLSIAKRERLESLAQVMVITDVRFHNEADWVRDHGVLVHVTGRQSELDPQAAKHASEHALGVGPNDFILDNSGSLTALSNRVNELRAQLAPLIQPE